MDRDTLVSRDRYTLSNSLRPVASGALLPSPRSLPVDLDKFLRSPSQPLPLSRLSTLISFRRFLPFQADLPKKDKNYTKDKKDLRPPPVRPIKRLTGTEGQEGGSDLT